MTAQEFYESIGGDYADVRTRLPSDDFVLRFLKKFPGESTYSELLAAVESGDITAQFEAAHKLKGIAGNLAFTKLYKKVSKLTEQLRPQTEQADPELVVAVKKNYDKIIFGINELFSE